MTNYQRQLATIIFTDNIGYTCAVSADQNQVLDVLQVDLIADAIPKKRNFSDDVLAWQIAILNVKIEEKEETEIWLQKAYVLYSISLLFTLIDPLIDEKRNDQIFGDLVRKMNLNGD